MAKNANDTLVSSNRRSAAGQRNEPRFDSGLFALDRESVTFGAGAIAAHEEIFSAAVKLFKTHAKKNGESALVSQLDLLTATQLVVYLSEYAGTARGSDDLIAQHRGYLDRRVDGRISQQDAPAVTDELLKILSGPPPAREDLLRILCHYELQRADNIPRIGALRELHTVLGAYDREGAVRLPDEKAGHITTSLGLAFRLPAVLRAEEN